MQWISTEIIIDVRRLQFTAPLFRYNILGAAGKVPIGGVGAQEAGLLGLVAYNPRGMKPSLPGDRMSRQTGRFLSVIK